MMKRSINMIMLLSALSGCMPFSGEKILDGEIGCSPPCWMSIIPGETTINDAFAILSKDDEENKSTTRIFADGEIWWRSESQYKANIFQNETDTVDRIEIDIRPEFDSLANYIGKLGSPQYITIISIIDGYFFPLFIYPEKGIAIFGSDNDLNVKGSNLECTINSDLRIYKLVFFQPTSNIDFLQPVWDLGGIEIETSKIFEWEEYGEYKIPN